jgi:ketosteroid isomerase-like protein
MRLDSALGGAMTKVLNFALCGALLIVQSIGDSRHASIAAQPTSSSEAEVRQVLADLTSTLPTQDAKALDQLYADEFTATNASGTVLDKAAVVGARMSGAVAFRTYEFEDVNIRIYGDVAVIRDSERIDGTGATGRFRHLRVLVRQNGRWRAVATQMTRIVEK